MKRFFFFWVWMLGHALAVCGQGYAFRGEVLDPSGEPLVGATLRLRSGFAATVSDPDGRFELGGLRPGEHQLLVEFLGFEPLLQRFELRQEGDRWQVRDSAGGWLDAPERWSFRLVPRAFVTDEVAIRATRLGERQPMAHQNLDREQLGERNQGQDLPYLLALTPSLVTTSDAGTGIGYTGLRVRGTDANRINVTVNGIPLNDPESHGVFWVNMPDLASSVESVQVQRGVGSSQNGAAAFGATVNLNTNQLASKPHARAETHLGSFNTRRASVGAGTGLMGEHFSFDARLSSIQSDGFIDRAWSDLKSYYLSGAYRDAKNLLRVNTFSGLERTYQAWYGVPDYIIDTNLRYNPYTYDNQIDHYQQTHYQLFYTRQARPDWNHNLALHYTRGLGYFEEYEAGQDFAAYGLAPPDFGELSPTATDLVRRRWLDNHFYGMVFSSQWQGPRLRMVGGGGWNHYLGDHFGEVIWAQFMPQQPIRHRWYEGTGNKTDASLYLKANLRLGRLDLMADLQGRAIDYRITGTDNDLRAIGQQHDFLFFNPKAGLHFEHNELMASYFSVAVASREPNRGNFVDAPAGQVPRPETLTDFELGHRVAWQRISLALNAYLMRYRDQLVHTGQINDVGAPIMANVPRSHRAGIELSAQARPFPALEAQANLTLSRNKIDDFVAFVDNWSAWSEPEQPWQFTESLGQTDLAFSPAVIASGRLAWAPFEGAKLLWNFQHVGRQFIDNSSSSERMLEAYTVHELRLSHSFELPAQSRLNLNLAVINLFGHEYESNAWVYRYYEDGQAQQMLGYYPQAGRHFLVGMVWEI